MKNLTPQDIYPPFAKYSHGVLVPEGWQLLFCSGQLGIAPDGEIPADVSGQCELCFANIGSVLAAAGMSLSHVVRINAYLTRREDLADYMAVRDRLFGAPPPASTLMLVSGFAREDFKVEVEAIAAGPAVHDDKGP